MLAKRYKRYYYGDILGSHFYCYQVGLRVHYLGFRGLFWIESVNYQEKSAMLTCGTWKAQGKPSKKVSLKGVGLIVAGWDKQRGLKLKRFSISEIDLIEQNINLKE